MPIPGAGGVLSWSKGSAANGALTPQGTEVRAAHTAHGKDATEARTCFFVCFVLIFLINSPDMIWLPMLEGDEGWFSQTPLWLSRLEEWMVDLGGRCRPPALHTGKPTCTPHLTISSRFFLSRCRPSPPKAVLSVGLPRDVIAKRPFKLGMATIGCFRHLFYFRGTSFYPVPQCT